MPEKYDHVKRERREIFTNNLIGGLAWGIGATLGLAILIALLGLVAHYINFVPIIGNFVSQIIDYIIHKNALTMSSNLPFLWSQFYYA